MPRKREKWKSTKCQAYQTLLHRQMSLKHLRWGRTFSSYQLFTLWLRDFSDFPKIRRYESLEKERREKKKLKHDQDLERIQNIHEAINMISAAPCRF